MFSNKENKMNTSSVRMDSLLNEWKNWLVGGDQKINNGIDFITQIFCRMIKLSMHYEFHT